ncbi:MAG: response regulator [Zoogloeaceae bacterium]|jgi:twitching motility two-component system response regulator PilH|nr:response regulator [Zoogloeaceae bacterium]
MGLFDNFRLFFKADPNAEEEPISLEPGVPEERRHKPRLNPREGTRVLVIDDSRTITSALKRILRSAGCVAFEAEDAESGLRLVLSHKPELIFLDIVLPGINGFAALRALRRDERTKHIPIIMMSGNEQATAQFFGTRIGADDFIKKPFSRQEIFARVERLLDEELVPRRIPQPTEAEVAAESALAPKESPPAPHINAHQQAAALLRHPS